MAGRPPDITPPYSLADAGRSVAALRRGRADAGDPDLAFFPALAPGEAPAVDDDTVDDAVRYAGIYRRVRADVLGAELADRAALITYQHERDVLAYKRRLYAVLSAGHDLDVPASAYGPAAGLPTRAAVWNRRTRYAADLAGECAGADSLEGTALGEWLRVNHPAVLAVAAALADAREELLAATAAPDLLAEAIDAAGAGIDRRPTRALASAVSRAIGLALGESPRSQPVRLSPDCEVRQVLVRHRRLRAEFEALTTRSLAG